jgi:hypothetical protein
MILGFNYALCIMNYALKKGGGMRNDIRMDAFGSAGRLVDRYSAAIYRQNMVARR